MRKSLISILGFFGTLTIALIAGCGLDPTPLDSPSQSLLSRNPFEEEQPEESGPPPSKANLIGTWKFIGATCDGYSVSMNGFSSILTVTEEEATLEASANWCNAKLTGMTFSDLETSPKISGGTPSCNPSRCSLEFTIKALIKSEKVEIGCPSDLTEISGYPIVFSTYAANVKINHDSSTCYLTYKKY